MKSAHWLPTDKFSSAPEHVSAMLPWLILLSFSGVPRWAPLSPLSCSSSTTRHRIRHIPSAVLTPTLQPPSKLRNHGASSLLPYRQLNHVISATLFPLCYTISVPWQRHRFPDATPRSSNNAPFLQHPHHLHQPHGVSTTGPLPHITSIHSLSCTSRSSSS